MLPSVYILAPTISLKKCQFSRYYLIIYQLQQLASKSVHFHVTTLLYTSYNNQPQKVSIFMLLSVYILAPTILALFSPFFAKNTFFSFDAISKIPENLQRIGLNRGNAHVKSFQWYVFGLGAIGKSLSLIRPIFHFFTHPFLG